jgi:hypothetical protein
MALDKSRSPQQQTEGINNVAAYRVPITAMLQGRPVRIVATGDWPGHSPVCQFVDEQGRLDWAVAEQFTVIDPQFLPPSQESLREISRSIQQAQQSTLGSSLR